MPIREVEKQAQDLLSLVEMAEADDDESLAEEIASETESLHSIVRKVEVSLALSGPHDAGNCFLQIHPGAGGTESCDWASMLVRMYLRYAERESFKVEMIESQPGDEAGIKSATFLIKGEMAYGRLRSESGIHRLVRISPFDSNARRHTSFVAVFVLPEIDDTIDIEIDEKDLRIDTYSSSGAGGQHVNRTASAVRIVHHPTGIVVTCQNERSQHKNKAIAMKVLRARLYELERRKHEEKVSLMSSEKKNIAWGNQIRSYVFQPYTLVKDHRTDHETGNLQAVMDGDLNGFVEAYLRWSISA